MHYQAPEQPRYELLTVYDREVAGPNQRMGPFSDSCYAAWFIREGGVALESVGLKQQASPGSWVFCAPFFRRTHRFQPNTRIISVRFIVRWAGGNHLPPLEPPRVLPDSECPGLLDLAQTLVETARNPARGFEGCCAVESRFQEWLVLWHRLRGKDSRPASTDPRVARMVEVLNGRTGLGVMEYEELQKATGLRRAQIDRLARQQLGTTPREWCERRTLAEAELLLRAGVLSVKEIAARLGFTDASHFAKWFRRVSHRSPLEFRRHPSV